MIRKVEEIIWSYFEGNVTEKEIDFIFHWLDEGEENRKHFVTLKKTFMEISAQAVNKEFSESAYNKFLDRVNRYEAERQSEKDSRIKQLRVTIWRYASIIIIALSVGLLAYYAGSRSSVSDSKTFCEIEVPYGAKSMLILPDSSKIWLNAGSKFRYNRNFDVSSREVYLEGEAFFDVQKRKHPMVVHTSHLDIEVLGTTFNVKSYPDEDNIEATLVEGNIRINSKTSDRPLFLKPKEKLTFHKPDKQMQVSSYEIDKTGIQVKETIASRDLSVTQLLKDVDIAEDVNTDESTSWKDGKLIINNEPLEELTKKLQRKYDVTFMFDSERLKEYSYSGTLRDFPLEQVLKALELTSPIKYMIREKTVILYYNKNFKPITQNY